jgi:hypothetical protein
MMYCNCPEIKGKEYLIKTLYNIGHLVVRTFLFKEPSFFKGVCFIYCPDPECLMAGMCLVVMVT